MTEVLKELHITPFWMGLVAQRIVNDLAFNMRRSALKEMRATMTIRMNKFSSQVGVKMAKRGTDKHWPEAEVYTKQRGRFTGWIEQETGRPKSSIPGKIAPNEYYNTRVETLFGRRGSGRNQIKPKHRMKSGDIPSSENAKVPFKRNSMRSRIFLFKINRDKYKGLFILKNHPKIPPGVYYQTSTAKGRNKIRRVFLLNQKVSIRRNRFWTRAQKRISKQDVLMRSFEVHTR